VERSTFEARLRAAAQLSVQFARVLIQKVLPEGVVFVVYPNQSYDGHPRVGDEVVFPGESLPDGQYHGPWSAADVVDFLWRGGRVPEWIDTAVQAQLGDQTVVGLLCCGRFTAQEGRLYYQDQDPPGFGIKSPIIPRRWVSIEVSGKFPLYWWERLHPDKPCHS